MYLWFAAVFIQLRNKMLKLIICGAARTALDIVATVVVVVVVLRPTLIHRNVQMWQVHTYINGCSSSGSSSDDEDGQNEQKKHSCCCKVTSHAQQCALEQKPLCMSTYTLYIVHIVFPSCYTFGIIAEDGQHRRRPVFVGPLWVSLGPVLSNSSAYDDSVFPRSLAQHLRMVVSILNRIATAHNNILATRYTKPELDDYAQDNTITFGIFAGGYLLISFPFRYLHNSIYTLDVIIYTI